MYCLIALVVGGVAGFLVRLFIARLQLSSAEEQAKMILETARKDAETTRREAILETKDALLEEKNKVEIETRERRAELTQMEKRLLLKEENLDQRFVQMEKREQTLHQGEKDLERDRSETVELQQRFQSALENLSGMTAEQAREMLINDLQEEAKHEATKYVNKIETEARQIADRKARSVIVTAIQHCVPEVVSEASVSSVALPNDEMKGRIIGREGRNIRALEVLTGVDVIIDDTPEAVVISCFDPVRREIAKLSLERLITDGRIHPAMIEEVVEKVRRDVEKIILEEGEKAVFDLGLHSLHPELIKALGRLKYRTSYGQNVLDHSRSVANISGLMAGELGANVEMAIRGGLLHDIGKGIEVESGGGHALIGSDFARINGEDAQVVNIIAAHHGDRETQTLEAVIVSAADAISAARPGARKESLENYIKRLENLENIANDFRGVEKSFAIQAGRELRIMVKNEKVNDAQAQELARDIARRIEKELKYPGIVKVTVIRETRIVEYAS